MKRVDLDQLDYDYRTLKIVSLYNQLNRKVKQTLVMKQRTVHIIKKENI